jgi:hypothetical protein
MRSFILLVLAVIAALPARAGKRVTVSQLEQALTAASGAHKSDTDTVHLINSMELSERLNEVTLVRIKTQLKMSSGVSLALQLLADQSAFLDPPASELPANPAPDDAAQQRMIEAARSYVAQMITRLPNLLATRTINRYDDSPLAIKEGGWAVREGLHLAYTSSGEVSVRNERSDPSIAQANDENELTSWGEFGYLLGVILTDTLKGKVAWSHWEQTGSSQVAVFQYSVPGSASHYEVIETINRGPRLSNQTKQPNTSAIHTKPGYHGALWLDLSTGTISRVTIETDSKEQFRHAAIMVRYGSVQIGDSRFICPVQSLAIYEAIADATASLSDAPTKWMNVTVFSGYHRFAATTRILPDRAAPK